MAVTTPTWLDRAADATRGLAQRPWVLFALLLALNAVGRPCSATAHDARLYSLQALNQAEAGAYGQDIFLLYGSQDQYSLFSWLVGPLVSALGLRLAFFLLYLVFNTLFLFALFRFVRALIDDALVSTFALIFLVTAPLAYGGYDVFMVHEQFFTPRIVGSALTLFALERLLRQRFVIALYFLLAALLVHPLMAFGGVMIWTGFVAASGLPPRWFLGIFATALVAFATVLSVPVLGESMFGVMDADWHRAIRLSVGYNYPDDWLLKDWINLALSFALPIVACMYLYGEDELRRRFFFIVVLAGAVGFAATVVASLSPYALLFQGQPYRVLWILKVVQVPLGFLLIARWSQSPAISARSAALVLVAFFCFWHYTTKELAIFGMMGLLSLAFSRIEEPAKDLWHVLARGLVLGALAWVAYRWWFLWSNRAIVAEHFDLDEWVMLDVVGPSVWLVGFCIIAAWTRQHGTAFTLSPRLVASFALAVALLTPLALFATAIAPAFQRDHTRLGSDMAFVREFLREHRAERPTVPGVYCSLGRPDRLWIDLRATSYFDILQTAGVMFQRRTAAEIKRRVALVSKFEMQRQRKQAILLDDAKKVGLENLFEIPFDSPAPTPADLVKLCSEPGLDYVVIPQEFPGLYSASNGKIFVYESYKVRKPITRNSP